MKIERYTLTYEYSGGVVMPKWLFYIIAVNIVPFGKRWLPKHCPYETCPNCSIWSCDRHYDENGNYIKGV